MATIHTIRPRHEDLKSVELTAYKFYDMANGMVETTGITLDQAIEFVKMSYKMHDDDIKDEQLSGICYAIEGLKNEQEEEYQPQKDKVVGEIDPDLASFLASIY